MKNCKFVLMMALLLCGCSSFNVNLKEEITVEYGEEILAESLTDQEGVRIKELTGFDSKKVGEQEITVVFVNGDEKTTEEKIKVTVEDTKAPEIKLKKDKLEITEGDDFNPASNIGSVKDPVDGDIKKSDDSKVTKNGYIITSDVDAKKVKDGYKVKITAYDVNGNKAEKEYTVNVKAKPEEPKQSAPQTTYTAPAQSGGGNSASGSGVVSAGSAASTPAAQPQAPSTSTPSGPCNHRGYHPVEDMWFDTADELDAWAWQYQNEQWDKGINIGSAYGGHTCPDCGKIGINEFY